MTADGAGGDGFGDVAGIFDAAVGDHRHARASPPRPHSMMAVICGTPAPVTTRVVQIEPGPMPTFNHQRRARSGRARLGRGDIARDELHFCQRFFTSLMASITRVGVAVRRIERKKVDVFSRELLTARSRKSPVAPMAQRLRAAGLAHPLRHSGKSIFF